ncbi:MULTISPECIES: HTH domain-containing protein [Prevotella]|nr:MULTISPECIES: HTH domain-containing protein [Prevotella]
MTNVVLARRLGISDRMVRKHITTLKSIGLLSRVGSNKTGYWKLK